MKVMNRRLLGAITAVAALIASATVTVFANAPNTDVVGGSGDQNTVQATVQENARTSDNVQSNINALTLNGLTEGNALAGDCLVTAVFATQDIIERGDKIKATTTATPTNQREALHDVVYHNPANVTMANFKANPGAPIRVEGGVLTGAWLATVSSTNGAFSGAT